jgi:hypothetical protein
MIIVGHLSTPYSSYIKTVPFFGFGEQQVALYNVLRVLYSENWPALANLTVIQTCFSDL